jgi:DNA-binding beta-propeller fold protein YncE
MPDRPRHAAAVCVLAAALAVPGSAAGAGATVFDGCLANDASQGCVDVPAAPLESASGVAVSPDGSSVYVASQLGDSVSHFSRDTASGRLTWQGCLADTDAQGCVDVPLAPLDHVSALTVSPDGKSVYVTSPFGDLIAHLFRDTVSGELKWDACLNNDGSESCVNLPGTPLSGAFGVAVSPEGKSVYVASQFSDSIAHFVVSGPEGQISYDSCLANSNPMDVCIDVPGTPLDGAETVALSPDGKSVYVPSFDSGSITQFSRDADSGLIGYVRCLANTNAMDGCIDVPAAPLRNAVGVAVSPDGKSVYVTSLFSSSISHFREPVAPAPPGPGGSPTPAPPPADVLAPRISRLSLTNRTFRVGRAPTALAARVPVGTTFRYTLSEPARVRVAFQRRRAGRWRRAGRALTRAGKTGRNRLRFSGRIGRRKLRAGAYRARFVATDAAGNRSRTATVRFRIVAGSR